MVFQPKLSLKYYSYMLHLLNALATFSSVNLNNPKNTIEERLICKKKKNKSLNQQTMPAYALNSLQMACSKDHIDGARDIKMWRGSGDYNKMD